jgi:hypothetical protein
MPDKQLNVWIPEELKTYLSERANQEGRGMNMLVADLIRRDMARRTGKAVEQQSLPAIQEIVRAEIRQAAAQLRHDLREDIKLDAVDVIHDQLRRGFDRLAALCVHAIRSAGICFRLVYALLAKAYGPSFAREALEDAREKVHRELFPPKQEQEVE